MKLKAIAIAALALLVCVLFVGCNALGKSYNLKDPVELARDNVEKAKQYHEIIGKLQTQQAEFSKFATDWNKVCAAAGNTIQRDQYGEPACLPPPPPQPQAAAPSPSPAPQVPASQQPTKK